eukprot:5089401-Amphidinium_carterae.1
MTTSDLEPQSVCPGNQLLHGTCVADMGHELASHCMGEFPLYGRRKHMCTSFCRPARVYLRAVCPGISPVISHIWSSKRCSSSSQYRTRAAYSTAANTAVREHSSGYDCLGMPLLDEVHQGHQVHHEVPRGCMLCPWLLCPVQARCVPVLHFAMMCHQVLYVRCMQMGHHRVDFDPGYEVDSGRMVLVLVLSLPVVVRKDLLVSCQLFQLCLHQFAQSGRHQRGPAFLLLLLVPTDATDECPQRWYLHAQQLCLLEIGPLLE